MAGGSGVGVAVCFSVVRAGGTGAQHRGVSEGMRNGVSVSGNLGYGGLSVCGGGVKADGLATGTGKGPLTCSTARHDQSPGSGQLVCVACMCGL